MGSGEAVLETRLRDQRRRPQSREGFDDPPYLGSFKLALVGLVVQTGAGKEEGRQVRRQVRPMGGWEAVGRWGGRLEGGGWEVGWEEDKKWMEGGWEAG